MKYNFKKDKKYNFKYPFDNQLKNIQKIIFSDNLYFNKIIVLLRSLYWEWNV